MELQTEQIMITESITTKTKLFLGLLLITISVISYGGFLYYKNNLVISYIDAEPLAAIGLDSINDTGVAMDGSIYFETLDDTKNTIKYRYDVTTALVTQIQFSTSTSAENRLFLARTSNGTLQPHFFNKSNQTVSLLPNVGSDSVQDFVVSPDQTQYAYSFETLDIDREDGVSGKEWNIAIHTLGNDEVLTIQNAREPKWLNGGDTVLYIAADGIYRVHITEHSPEKIFPLYENYSTEDHITVSPDGKKVILVKKDQNLLALLAFENDDSDAKGLFEVGRIINSEKNYQNPIFSTDSLFYAVVGRNNLDADSADSQIELRYVFNAEVIKTAVLKDVDYRNLSINTWTVE